jgi:hypothetical protein
VHRYMVHMADRHRSTSVTGTEHRQGSGVADANEIPVTPQYKPAKSPMLRSSQQKNPPLAPWRHGEQQPSTRRDAGLDTEHSAQPSTAVRLRGPTCHRKNAHPTLSLILAGRQSSPAASLGSLKNDAANGSAVSDLISSGVDAPSQFIRSSDTWWPKVENIPRPVRASYWCREHLEGRVGAGRCHRIPWRMARCENSVTNKVAPRRRIGDTSAPTRTARVASACESDTSRKCARTL